MNADLCPSGGLEQAERELIMLLLVHVLFRQRKRIRCAQIFGAHAEQSQLLVERRFLQRAPGPVANGGRVLYPGIGSQYAGNKFEVIETQFYADCFCRVSLALQITG